MRVHFDELFSLKNGMVQPKAPVHINGITMTSGVSFGGGVLFGGVDLTQFIGKYLEVDKTNDGVYIIKGVY